MTALKTTLQRLDRRLTPADAATDQRVGTQLAIDADIPALRFQNGVRVRQVHPQPEEVDGAAARGDLLRQRFIGFGKFDELTG